MAKRVLVTGAMAQHPLGGAGNAWAFLQYVLGFRRLGFETYYAEELSACIDEDWNPTSFERSANASFMAHIVAQHALGDRVAVFATDDDGHVGMTREELESLAPEIDLLVNISGRFHLRSILGAVRSRLYLDLDPGFTQIWQAQYGVDMNLKGHDIYATVGLNLGKADSPLPTCGVQWHTTVPPVVLSEWATPQPPGPAYTTVADWRGYSPVEWDGVWYGQKAEEFLRIIDLPTRVTAPIEVCMAIHPNEPDLPALQRNKWRLTSPRAEAATTESYRAYIQRSRGECTPVKHGYAAGRTGWFSDRSACYLAAGRPVIMQETGVSRYLPTGEGVVTFTDLDSAVAAVEQVENDYPRHATAASAFARTHLDSDVVLNNLWELAVQSR